MDKGFSLVEIIVASAILGMFFVSMSGVWGGTTALNKQSSVRTNLIHEAQNLLEYVRSIRNRDFSLLASGEYGVVRNGQEWEFTPSPQEENGITKKVLIEEEEGDMRLVTAEIESHGITHTLSTLFTNWRQVIDSIAIEIDASGSSVGGQGRRTLQDVVVRNGGNQDVTLVYLTLGWTKETPSRRLWSVTVDEDTVWGSLLGAPSDTQLPISVIVPANGEVVFDFVFTRSMNNREFTLKLETNTGELIVETF